MKKKILSMLLVLLMVMTLVPVSALAWDKDNDIPYAVTGGNIYFREDQRAITGCDSTVTEAVIPSEINGVAVHCIWSSAFAGCESLTSVIIPNSVTWIDEYAFSGCTGLTSITIPNSVTSMNRYAFESCTNLKSVTLSNSLTGIDDGVFYSCESLTSITIPNGVKHIANHAFNGCTGLMRVEIPDSVISIGWSPFSRCTSLTSINVADTNPAYSSDNGILFNKDKTELIQYTVGKTNASYAIPDSVTSIGVRAFYCCESLRKVIFPNNVMSIDNEAFENCTNLTSVIIPSGVTSINYETFNGCTSLTSVTIPSSITSIEWEAFDGCKSLTDVYYSGTKEQWNKIAIEEYNKPLLNAKIHYNSGAPVDPIDPIDPIDPVDPVEPVTPTGFTDIPSDAFYANAVKWAVENEITTGVGNNRFDPNGQCTRGQVVTFLWRAAGKPTVSANVSFSDVQPGAFYYEAVKWAVANGITTGVGGNRFAPNDSCTRGQVVTVLHRAENSPAASTISSFTDVPATAFYYNAVNWAVANGITNGTGNGRFSPNDSCTRGQVVTFLYRAQ